MLHVNTKSRTNSIDSDTSATLVNWMARRSSVVKIEELLNSRKQINMLEKKETILKKLSTSVQVHEEVASDVYKSLKTLA